MCMKFISLLKVKKHPIYFSQFWYAIPPYLLHIKTRIYCVWNSYFKCLENMDWKFILNLSPFISAKYGMKRRFPYLNGWKTGSIGSTVFSSRWQFLTTNATWTTRRWFISIRSHSFILMSRTSPAQFGFQVQVFRALFESQNESHSSTRWLRSIWTLLVVKHTPSRTDWLLFGCHISFFTLFGIFREYFITANSNKNTRRCYLVWRKKISRSLTTTYALELDIDYTLQKIGKRYWRDLGMVLGFVSATSPD